MADQTGTQDQGQNAAEAGRHSPETLAQRIDHIEQLVGQLTSQRSTSTPATPAIDPARLERIEQQLEQLVKSVSAPATSDQNPAS